MIFEVKSLDDLLGFGMYKYEYENSNLFMKKRANISIGTKVEVIKKPYRYEGIRFVDFKIVGEDTEYFIWWGEFQKHSKLIEGEVIETRKPLMGLSNGKYAGFDLEIAKVKEQIYEPSGYGLMEIYIKFIGELQGAKQINTKIINIIKRLTFASNINNIVVGIIMVNPKIK